MKRGGGRVKGNAFERQVAKMIVEAFSDHGIDSKHCYRTPLSGGHRYAKKCDPGDLVMSPELRKLFPFAVEAKSYKRLKWRELLSPLKKSGQFYKWWQQACLGATSQGLNPLLVFKENNSPIYAMVVNSQVQDPWNSNPYISVWTGDRELQVVQFRHVLSLFVARAK